jgi:enoyl-CoA hydratase
MKSLPTDGMIVQQDGAIGWIIFSNPARHNAVSLAMWQSLGDAVDKLAEASQVRVIVVRGAGEKAFVSGADISEFEEKRSDAEIARVYDETSGRAMAALREVNKPTVAMIRGYCFGGGVAVALCCDLRIAADDSVFAIPAAKLGVGYQFEGVRKLVDVVGPSFAREIFYTGCRFSAQEALAMGLVNRVTTVEALESYVRDYVAAIAANAPLTIRSIKTLVAQVLKDPSERDLHLCAEVVDRCFASADFAEGRRAFMEKREPRFNGS